MSSEIETVNEIIQAEIDETLNAAIKPRTSVEILEEAHNLYYDERTLEHWRELFFAEQRRLTDAEHQVAKYRRLLGRANDKLRRAKIHMEGVKSAANTLSAYLHAQMDVVKEATVEYNVARVALNLLHQVTMHIAIPNVSETKFDDIPF